MYSCLLQIKLLENAIPNNNFYKNYLDKLIILIIQQKEKIIINNLFLEKIIDNERLQKIVINLQELKDIESLEFLVYNKIIENNEIYNILENKKELIIKIFNNDLNNEIFKYLY